jgi:hypothetical protein
MKFLKQIIAIAALTITAFTTNAQVKIGANPTTITPNTNLEVEATNGQKVVITKSIGDVGIGTNAPTAKLRVIDSTLDDSRTYGYYVSAYLKPVPTTSYTVADYSELFTLPTDAADHAILAAKHSRTFHYGSGTINEQRGYAAVARNMGSGTVNNQFALNTDVSNGGAGNVTNSIGLQVRITNNGSGIITNAIGNYIYVDNFAGGSITNGYGIKIDNIQGINRWAIYSATDAPSYFQGNVGIGTAAPVSRLNVNLQEVTDSVTFSMTNGKWASFKNNGGGGSLRLSSSANIHLQTNGVVYFQDGINNNSTISTGKSSTTGLFTNSYLNAVGGNVGIGAGFPDVKLAVNGYIKVGSADATGDATPVPGMIRYNSATDKFEGYTTTGWVNLN